MTMSLTPDDQRERADATPAGPAPITRTDVLDGRDWDIVGESVDYEWGNGTAGCLNTLADDGPG